MDAAPPTQLDEGYSEADMNFTHDTDEPDGDDVKRILQMVLSLPAGKRKDIVQGLIPSLPNPMKEDLQQYIETLTHFDPAIYLPNELVLQIFSYLAPADLLAASRISRAWRERAQDEKLWRACFAREGWVLDKAKMEAFERFAEKKGRKVAEKVVRTPLIPAALERKGSRKRGRDEAFSEGEAATVGTMVDGVSDDDSENGMEGVEATSAEEHNAEGVAEAATPASSTKSVQEAFSPPSGPSDFKLRPTLFQTAASQEKLSWPYLYKQRRRLESNWEQGKYKMFQLPHPQHPEEGHEECVYTIQHTTRHLVSGSRDRTIRVWDLATLRLKGAPLRGHEASVLCLQFDERPDHDIIVSGGSDASVIIWRFSTGEQLKKIPLAHQESVLNLRFDDRYIVTCSKDKSIKLWTRHSIPRDSPLVPAHVLPHFMDLPDPLIAEYTLLTTLMGHNAAVNAVMIHDSTIVSASGDRTIKSWDLATGALKKNYAGHTKGIACVQFDGRRIVSGSSDNSVRIFDAEQQAEIACLTGHTNLVRTVQARFGDLAITSDEELAEQAREADANLIRALDAGMSPARASRRSTRNAGSSAPEDMLAYGTRVPPGGGGSRWAKIVSGSYDETVILWKRDRKGKWIPWLKLNQDQLLRTGGPGRNAQMRRVPAPALAGPATGQGNDNNDDAQAPFAGPSTAATATVPGGPPGPASAGAAGPQTLAQAQAHHNIATAQGLLVQANQLLQNSNQQAGTQAQAQQNLLPAASQMVASMLQQQQNNNNIGAHVNFLAAQHQAAQAQAQAQGQVQGQAHAQGAAAGAGAAVPQAVLAHAQHVAQGHHHHHHPRAGESNRVFKLQFDARRIICCSQNKVIVGWDFADGDAELERVGEWSLETA